jgi:predicted GNAT family N-acyltransferase
MQADLSITCKPFSALSPFELYDILHLRHIVFSIEQNCLYIDTDGFDHQAYHLMIKDQETLVAYARLFGLNMPYPGSYLYWQSSHTSSSSKQTIWKIINANRYPKDQRIIW